MTPMFEMGIDSCLIQISELQAKVKVGETWK